MRKKEMKKLAFCALFGALGFVLMLLEFPLPIIPSFVKLDFSELPALIVSFVYGPLYGIAVCLLKNLLHLFVTTSAGVGEVSNFILGAIFVGVAGLIYKYNKNRKFALIGSLVGALVMAVISVASNYLLFILHFRYYTVCLCLQLLVCIRQFYRRLTAFLKRL